MLMTEALQDLVDCLKSTGWDSVMGNQHQAKTLFVSLAARRQALCQSTCSWNATQRRRCTAPIRASTGLGSAIAPTTRASSSTRTPGQAEDGAPPPSPLKPHSKWTRPTTRRCSNVPSTNRCPRRPAEDETSALALGCWSQKRGRKIHWKSHRKFTRYPALIPVKSECPQSSILLLSFIYTFFWGANAAKVLPARFVLS